MLPGVTVTLTGPILLQPLTAVDLGNGTVQFPRLHIGTYSLKFELGGFKTIVQEGVQITVGFSANISPQLGVSTVQETVTVTGETPVVDTKQTGTKPDLHARAAAEHSLGARPVGHARSRPPASPWTARTSAATCRASSRATSRAARNPTNNKWSLDGVDITDMVGDRRLAGLLRLRHVRRK